MYSHVVLHTWTKPVLCCCFSLVWLCATLWTIALQAFLSRGFSKQDYWNQLPFLSPGDLPNPRIEPVSLTSPALAGGFFAISVTWEYLYFKKTNVQKTVFCSLCWKTTALNEFFHFFSSKDRLKRPEGNWSVITGVKLLLCSGDLHGGPDYLCYYHLRKK